MADLEKQLITLLNDNLKRKIMWNVINSLLACFLVILGALASGRVEFQSVFVAVIAGLAAAVVQFKEFWAKEASEFCVEPPKTLFQFV